MDDSMD